MRAGYWLDKTKCLSFLADRDHLIKPREFRCRHAECGLGGRGGFSQRPKRGPEAHSSQPKSFLSSDWCTNGSEATGPQKPMR